MIQYTGTFKSVKGVAWRIEIDNKRYMGEPHEMVFPENPLSIVKDRGSLTDTIVNSHGTLSIISESNYQYTDLMLLGDFEARIKIYREGVLYFEGWLDNTLYEEDFVAPPYEVKIKFTDGLNRLKNFPFSIEISIADYNLVDAIGVIVACLKKLNLSENKIMLNNSLHNEMFESDTPAIEQCYFDAYDLSQLGYKTYEVLESIIRLICCHIYQKNGVWYIERATNKLYNENEWIEYDMKTFTLKKTSLKVNKTELCNDDYSLKDSGSLTIENTYTKQSFEVDPKDKKSMYYKEPEKDFTPARNGEEWMCILNNLEKFNEPYHIHTPENFEYHDLRRWGKFGSYYDCKLCRYGDIKEGYDISQLYNSYLGGMVQTVRIENPDKASMKFSFKFAFNVDNFSSNSVPEIILPMVIFDGNERYYYHRDSEQFPITYNHGALPHNSLIYPNQNTPHNDCLFKDVYRYDYPFGLTDKWDSYTGPILFHVNLKDEWANDNLSTKKLELDIQLDSSIKYLTFYILPAMTPTISLYNDMGHNYKGVICKPIPEKYVIGDFELENKSIYSFYTNYTAKTENSDAERVAPDIKLKLLEGLPYRPEGYNSKIYTGTTSGLLNIMYTPHADNFKETENREGIKKEGRFIKLPLKLLGNTLNYRWYDTHKEAAKENKFNAPSMLLERIVQENFNNYSIKRNIFEGDIISDKPLDYDQTFTIQGREKVNFILTDLKYKPEKDTYSVELQQVITDNVETPYLTTGSK